MKIKYDAEKAHQTYTTSAGVRVPGVTTVLGIMAKPALIHWAWKLGMEGKDYKKVKDKAADAGTLAHWMIELYLRSLIGPDPLEPDLSEFSPALVKTAEVCFKKFIDWWMKQDLKPVACEVQLVHETLLYGGTLDILAERKGELQLIDIKTGKAIYDEMWMQLAAYQKLGEGKYDIRSCSICRFGKDDDSGDMEVQTRDNLDKHFNVFAACLAVYRAKQQLKG